MTALSTSSFDGRQRECQPKMKTEKRESATEASSTQMMPVLSYSQIIQNIGLFAACERMNEEVSGESIFSKCCCEKVKDNVNEDNSVSKKSPSVDRFSLDNASPCFYGGTPLIGKIPKKNDDPAVNRSQEIGGSAKVNALTSGSERGVWGIENSELGPSPLILAGGIDQLGPEDSSKSQVSGPQHDGKLCALGPGSMRTRNKKI
ncbi:hypothetical protein Ancab_029621 [Ancistrocladus abbreviatus]